MEEEEEEEEEKEKKKISYEFCVSVCQKQVVQTVTTALGRPSLGADSRTVCRLITVLRTSH